MDSSTLSFSKEAANGSLTISENQVLYTPNLDFFGLDSFEYKICTSSLKTNCDSAMVFVEVGLSGINQSSFSGSIKIYPQPSNGLLNVVISNTNNVQLYQYEIFNLTGQKLISGKLNVGLSTLNIKNQPNGIYYLKLTDLNNNSRMEKLFKSVN